MPYIKQDDRLIYKAHINNLIQTLHLHGNHPGHINYVFSKILAEILEHNRTYTECNKLIGVLECVKQELYRIQISELEDEKIKENGPI